MQQTRDAAEEAATCILGGLVLRKRKDAHLRGVRSFQRGSLSPIAPK